MKIDLERKEKGEELVPSLSIYSVSAPLSLLFPTLAETLLLELSFSIQFKKDTTGIYQKSTSETFIERQTLIRSKIMHTIQNSKTFKKVAKIQLEDFRKDCR